MKWQMNGHRMDGSAPPLTSCFHVSRAELCASPSINNRLAFSSSSARTSFSCALTSRSCDVSVSFSRTCSAMLSAWRAIKLLESFSFVCRTCNSKVCTCYNGYLWTVPNVHRCNFCLHTQYSTPFSERTAFTSSSNFFIPSENCNHSKYAIWNNIDWDICVQGRFRYHFLSACQQLSNVTEIAAFHHVRIFL